MTITELASSPLTSSRVPEKKVVDTRKATNVNLDKYDERLEDIAKTMNRWYGKDVVFLEESIKDKLFTGILDKGVGIEVFMRQLSETSGIKFVVSGNQLFIK